MCDGTESIVTANCSRSVNHKCSSGFLPTCASSTATTALEDACTTLGYSKTSVTCECNLCGLGVRRLRSLRNLQSTSSAAAEVATISSVLIGDFTDFQRENAQKFLTSEAYEKAAVVLSFFLAMWFLIVIIFIVTESWYSADSWRKGISSVLDLKNKGLFRLSTSAINTNKDIATIDANGQSGTEEQSTADSEGLRKKDVSKEHRASMHQKIIEKGKLSERVGSNARILDLRLSDKDSVSVILGYVHSLFPSIYIPGQKSYERLLHQFLGVHLLTSVVTGESTSDRMISALELATTWSMELFFIAFFCDIEFPTHDCSVYQTEETCIETKALLDSSRSLCEYNSDYEESCYLAEIEISPTMLIVVAVVIILFSTPLILLLSYLFDNLLRAPTAKDNDIDKGFRVNLTFCGLNVGRFMKFIFKGIRKRVIALIPRGKIKKGNKSDAPSRKLRIRPAPLNTNIEDKDAPTKSKHKQRKSRNGKKGSINKRRKESNKGSETLTDAPSHDFNEVFLSDSALGQESNDDDIVNLDAMISSHAEAQHNTDITDSANVNRVFPTLLAVDAINYSDTDSSDDSDDEKAKKHRMERETMRNIRNNEAMQRTDALEPVIVVPKSIHKERRGMLLKGNDAKILQAALQAIHVNNQTRNDERHIHRAVTMDEELRKGQSSIIPLIKHTSIRATFRKHRKSSSMDKFFNATKNGKSKGNLATFDDIILSSFKTMEKEIIQFRNMILRGQIKRLKIPYGDRFYLSNANPSISSSAVSPVSTSASFNHMITAASPSDLLDIFDKAWGIRDVNYADKTIEWWDELSVIEVVEKAYLDAVYMYRVVKHSPQSGAGIALIKLFTRDVLGYNSVESKVFGVRADVEFNISRCITLEIKIAAAALIILLNLYFLYVTMSYGLSKGRDWQMAWVESAVIIIIFDIVFKQTLEAILLAYFVPSSISNEMNIVATIVSQSVQRVSQDDYNETMYKRSETFSASDFLHASSLLARKVPNIWESGLILSNRCALPSKAFRLHTIHALKRVDKAEHLEQERQRRTMLSFVNDQGLELPSHVESNIPNKHTNNNQNNNNDDAMNNSRDPEEVSTSYYNFDNEDDNGIYGPEAGGNGSIIANLFSTTSLLVCFATTVLVFGSLPYTIQRLIVDIISPLFAGGFIIALNTYTQWPLYMSITFAVVTILLVVLGPLRWLFYLIKEICAPEDNTNNAGFIDYVPSDDEYEYEGSFSHNRMQSGNTQTNRKGSLVKANSIRSLVRKESYGVVKSDSSVVATLETDKKSKGTMKKDKKEKKKVEKNRKDSIKRNQFIKQNSKLLRDSEDDSSANNGVNARPGINRQSSSIRGSLATMIKTQIDGADLDEDTDDTDDSENESVSTNASHRINIKRKPSRSSRSKLARGESLGEVIIEADEFIQKKKEVKYDSDRSAEQVTDSGANLDDEMSAFVYEKAHGLLKAKKQNARRAIKAAKAKGLLDNGGHDHDDETVISELTQLTFNGSKILSKPNLSSPDKLLKKQASAGTVNKVTTLKANYHQSEKLRKESVMNREAKQKQNLADRLLKKGQKAKAAKVLHTYDVNGLVILEDDNEDTDEMDENSGSDAESDLSFEEMVSRAREHMDISRQKNQAQIVARQGLEKDTEHARIRMKNKLDQRLLQQKKNDPKKSDKNDRRTEIRL